MWIAVLPWNAEFHFPIPVLKFGATTLPRLAEPGVPIRLAESMTNPIATPRSATAEMEAAPSRASLVRSFGAWCSFPALLAAILALLVFYLALRPMADPDLPWHLRNAAYLLHTHHWIRSDMYAFSTYGMPWINHEWLAELPFYAAWRAFGTPGLLLITTLLLELIFFGLFLLARMVSGNTKTSWAAAFAGAVLGTVSFGPRMLLFGWVCLVGELLLIARFEARRGTTGIVKSFWPLPLLFLLWVNLHGSWLIGLCLFAIYIASGIFTLALGSIRQNGWSRRERRELGLILSLCGAALFANPYGWRLPAYPFDFAFRQTLNVASIEEWQPLNMQSTRAHVLLFILGVSFVAQLIRHRLWALYELAFVFTGIFAALTHTRFLFLASLISLPFLAQDLPWPEAKEPKERPLFHTAFLLLLGACGFHLTKARAAQVGEARDYPGKALPFLRAFHPQGRVFNNFLWGGYLELNAPNIPVFIDSRVDIFERRGVLRDYLDAAELKNTFAILDRNQIRYVLFEDDSALSSFLRESASWKTIYHDGTTVLFERAGPVPQPVLARR